LVVYLALYRLKPTLELLLIAQHLIQLARNGMDQVNDATKDTSPKDDKRAGYGLSFNLKPEWARGRWGHGQNGDGLVFRLSC